MNFEDDYIEPGEVIRPPDPAEKLARAELLKFFEARPEQVFFSRQIEVQFEDKFFHWITNRALRGLIDEGVLATETYGLRFGGKIKLIWKKTFRYHKRSANELVKLVSEYSEPAVSDALGKQGEMMVLSGFALNGCSVVERHARGYRDKVWTKSEQNLDMIVEKDGVGYGVEVKNTLPYISQNDFEAKLVISADLGLRPVFAVRMMPKSWINQLYEKGGYALILKYQLYPWGYRELARQVELQLGLPIRCVENIEQGVFDRFGAWHKKRM